MREGDHQHAAPECPRCGYDLRGETDRWTDACPLESVCPECGLGIRWTFVFGPMQAVPRWSVEHPSRRFTRALRETLPRTLLPTRFWDALVMSSHARPGSLVFYALLGAIAVSLIAAIPELAIDIKFGYLANLITPRTSWHSPSRAWQLGVYRGVSIILAPFGTLWWNRSNGLIPEVEWELLLAPLFVALCPAAYLCLPTTLNACKVRKTHIARAFLLGVPLAFVWFELLYLAHLLLLTARLNNAQSGFGAFLAAIEPALSAGLAWMLVLLGLQWRWWQAVNRRYLRLPNPAAVTASMLAIAGLATLIPLLAFTPLGVELVRLIGLG